jgi:hypothetical protein
MPDFAPKLHYGHYFNTRPVKKPRIESTDQSNGWKKKQYLRRRHKESQNGEEKAFNASSL